MRYGFIGLFGLLFCSAAAHATDLSGDYAGRCDNNNTVQCWIRISERTKVELTVADRLDFEKKRCVLSGTLQPTAMGLKGEIGKGNRLALRNTPEGGIYMSGLPVSACKIALNGFYGVIGD